MPSSPPPFRQREALAKQLVVPLGGGRGGGGGGKKRGRGPDFVVVYRADKEEEEEEEEEEEKEVEFPFLYEERKEVRGRSLRQEDNDDGGAQSSL